MLTSVFAEALERKDLPEREFFDWLESVSHFCFTPLIGEFATADIKKVAFYILHAYSQDSQMVILGADWEQNKGLIAEAVGLPTYLYGPVIFMENATVCEVIAEYLDLQGNRDFKHLQVKKDLYQIMQLGLLKGARDEKGESNFKLLRENSKESDKLLGDIEDLEELFRTKNQHVIAGKKEIVTKRVQNANQPAANVEASEYIS